MWWNWGILAIRLRPNKHRCRIRDHHRGDYGGSEETSETRDRFQLFPLQGIARPRLTSADMRAGCVVGPVCEYQDPPLCLCQDSGPKILPAEDEESSWRKPLFDAASDHDDLHGKSDASKVKMKMSKMVGDLLMY